MWEVKITGFSKFDCRVFLLISLNSIAPSFPVRICKYDFFRKCFNNENNNNPKRIYRSIDDYLQRHYHDQPLSHRSDLRLEFHFRSFHSDKTLKILIQINTSTTRKNSHHHASVFDIIDVSCDEKYNPT